MQQVGFLQTFIEGMSVAMLQAGYAAMSLQGKVSNEGKAVEHLEGDSLMVAAKRAAKTVVDEIAQEILLQAALQIVDHKITGIDAEEDTPSVSKFSKPHVSEDAGDRSD